MTFQLRTMPGHRIVQVTITGSLTLDDVAQLATAQADLVKDMSYLPGCFDLLVDSTGSPIQPIVVSAALCALSERDDFKAGRLAFVHGDTSVKMQLRRVNAGKHAGYFATVDAAMVWLTDTGGLNQ